MGLLDETVLSGMGLVANEAGGTALSLVNLFDLFTNQLNLINRNSPTIYQESRANEDRIRLRIGKIFDRYEIKKINVEETEKDYLFRKVLLDHGGDVEVATNQLVALGFQNRDAVKGEFERILKEPDFKSELVSLASSSKSDYQVRTSELFREVFYENQFGDKAAYFLGKITLYDLVNDDPNISDKIKKQLAPHDVDTADIALLRDSGRIMALYSSFRARANYHESCIGTINVISRLRGEEFTDERLLQNLVGIHGEKAEDKTLIFNLIPQKDDNLRKVVSEIDKIAPGYGNKVIDYFREMNVGTFNELLSKHRTPAHKIWGNMATACYCNALMGESETMVAMSIYDKAAMDLVKRELVFMTNAIQNNEEIYSVKRTYSRVNDEGTGYMPAQHEYYKARDYINDNREEFSKIYNYDFSVNRFGGDLTQKDVVAVLNRTMVELMENRINAREFGGRQEFNSLSRFFDRLELSLSLKIGVPETLANLPKGRLKGNIEEAKDHYDVNGKLVKEKWLDEHDLKPTISGQDFLKMLGGYLAVQTKTHESGQWAELIRPRINVVTELNDQKLKADWNYDKRPLRDPADWKYKENELGEPVWKKGMYQKVITNALIPSFINHAPDAYKVASKVIEKGKPVAKQLGLTNMFGMLKQLISSVDGGKDGKGGVLKPSENNIFRKFSKKDKDESFSNKPLDERKQDETKRKSRKVLKTIGMFLFPPTTPYVVGGWAGDFFHGSALSRVIGRTVMYSAALYAGIKEGPALENAIWPDYKIDNNIEDVRGYLGDKKITNVITLDSKQDIVLHDGERMALGYEGGAAAILKVKDDSLQISNIGIGSKAYMYKDKNGEEKIAYIDVHGSDASISTDPAKSLTGDGYFRKEEPVKGVMKDNDVSGKQPEEIIHMLDTKPMNINNNQLNK